MVSNIAQSISLLETPRREDVPTVNVVIPTKAATLLTCHSCVICPIPGLYAPAVNAVNEVMMHATQMIMFFLFSGQVKGSSKRFSSGGSGGAFWPSLEGDIEVGCGKSVAKVR
jgi:hypothetical protein